MAYSQAQNRATQKYIANNYDKMTLRFKKGDKEKYQQQAAAHGKSLTQYIIDLLEADRK